MSATERCERCGGAVAPSRVFCERCESARPAGGHHDTLAAPAAHQKRSRAWIYYSILSLLSVIAVFTGQPVGLVGSAACGAYARYLYRGGRIVVWFW